MKKITILLCSLALVLGTAGVACALSIDFDVSPTNSKVTINNVISVGWTSLVANLAFDPLEENFTLDEGATKEIDFFTLTATGTGLGYADISALLAFDAPPISTTGDGSVGWFTISGKISGGILTWDNLPDIHEVLGNYISIDFEEGATIVCGNTATVHAYITNNGPVTVPEPETMLMLGSVLLGLVAVTRKRFNDRT